MQKKEIIGESDSFDYKTLASIESENNNIVLSAVFSEAYNNVITMVDKSSHFVNNDRYLVDEYMIERLKIHDEKAVDIFIDSFAKISDKIKHLFNMYNKENIIIMTKKHSDSTKMAKDNIDANNRDLLGFSFVNDSLDRTFLNADIIPDDLTENFNEYEAFSRQEYYVNLMAETLCYEAIHALGNPDDYFYHRTDNAGKLQQVEDAIEYIEYFILTGQAFNERFNYICELYFMSNPVYNGFNIDSLMKPPVFHQLFLKDSYLSSVIFINNPDTLSLLIRDFSRDHILLL
ncbi:MAG: hypothetical protein ACMZI0_11810 [Symbiopectobacterium sp.]|uniref:hypothetical protein n=1 Tax=Symbiopectobacterium sp. TaxID=2952789 RepID=UPI0039EBF52D